MKSVFLCIVSFLGLLFNIHAQTKAEIQAQRAISIEQVATTAKEIGLTEKQTDKLKKVFIDLFASQDEIRADTTTTNAQKKELLTKANEKKDWKMQNLLGNQYKQFAEVRKRLIAEAEAKKKQGQ